MRRAAWLAILLVDAGFVAWGAMAALFPEHLPGPRGIPILTAGYEGFTGHSWAQLSSASPLAAAYISMLFRLYGAYCVAFGMLAVFVAAIPFRRGEIWAWWTLLIANSIAFASAMSYDWIAHAIGPFEMSEYVGIAAIYAALAITFARGADRPVTSTSAAMSV